MSIAHAIIRQHDITDTITIDISIVYFRSAIFCLKDLWGFVTAVAHQSNPHHHNMAEKFCLKWNDFHSNVSQSFGLFRNEDYLHDVTLVSDDHHQVSAHKLVLSACSEYFKNIFKLNNKPNTHPLLCLDGIKSDDLKNIMDYIYNGEVQIFQDDLDRFLSIAQKLKL